MPSLRFYNPANPKQQYQTISASDPNIPSGWLDTQGSDGAIPEAMKVYSVGTASGGFPAYGDLTTNVRWPNGIINSPTGNKVSPDR
jgi:hypothetical protein